MATYNIQKDSFDFWFSRDRISVTGQYCPMWEKPHYQCFTNGGWREGECLDMHINVHRIALSLTIWDRRALPRFVQRWMNSRMPILDDTDG